jgi:hypothetical protein
MFVDLCELLEQKIGKRIIDNKILKAQLLNH